MLGAPRRPAAPPHPTQTSCRRRPPWSGGRGPRAGHLRWAPGAASCPPQPTAATRHRSISHPPARHTPAAAHGMGRQGEEQGKSWRMLAAAAGTVARNWLATGLGTGNRSSAATAAAAAATAMQLRRRRQRSPDDAWLPNSLHTGSTAPHHVWRAAIAAWHQDGGVASAGSGRAVAGGQLRRQLVPGGVGPAQAKHPGIVEQRLVLGAPAKQNDVLRHILALCHGGGARRVVGG